MTTRPRLVALAVTAIVLPRWWRLLWTYHIEGKVRDGHPRARCGLALPVFSWRSSDEEMGERDPGFDPYPYRKCSVCLRSWFREHPIEPKP